MLSPRALVRVLCLAATGGLGCAAARGASLSEAGRPFIQNFTPRDYHGHNQMWATAQTSDGLLYFGNRVRVLEFDGVTWRAIKVPVPATYIRGLVPGSDGRLYVGSTDELGYIERGADGAMTYTSLTASLPPEARRFGVIQRGLAHDGAIYFVTLDGVLRYEHGRFRTWKFPEKTLPTLRSSGDALYLHREGVGLFTWRGDDFVPLGGDPLWQRFFPLAVVPDEPGEPLVALSNGSFYHLGREGALRPWKFEAADVLKNFRVRAALRLSSGLLALSSITDGVVLLSRDGRLLQQITETTGLESQRVLNLFEDREGNLWADTYNGTSRIEVNSPLSIFDRYSGLGREYVRQFCRHEGALYATSGTGLFRLFAADPAEGRPAHFERLAKLPDNLWGMVSHRSGLLVGGARGTALYANSELHRINPESCYAVVASRSQPDRVFVCCDRGVRFLRYDGAQWIDEGALPGFDGETRSAFEDDRGVLWVGSSTRGILKLTRPAGIDDWKKAVVVTYQESHGLPKGHGWTMIFPTMEGPLFVPQHGVYRYDYASDSFRPEARLCPDGDLDAVVGTVAQLPGGGYWLQAERPSVDHSLCIYALTPAANGGFTWVTQPRKLEDRIGFGGARTLYWENTPAGEAIWISAPDSTVRVDVSLRAPALPPWRALIREIQLPGGKKLGPANPGAAPPRFAHSREPFVFAFAAPRFGSGPAHEYQTRILGFDDHWSAWSAKTEATFTNLVGGPFTFVVRARDADGNLSEPARFTFAVAPPWHYSAWAFAGYALALGGGVAGFVRWRLRRAERERLRLEQLIGQRTEELRLAKNAADEANRAKSVFLANMSHELRTPLNGVIGYAQVLMKDRDLSPKNRERLQVVQNSGEHLLRMINEVLDFSKIEAGRMELAPAPFNLPQLLRDIAAAISPRIEQKRLEFVFEPASNLPDLVLGDPLKLRQVIDNLIGNAVKFTAQGAIRFRAEVSDVESEIVRFVVSDTGVGISETDRAKLFQPFQQAVDGRPPEPGTGLGLAISRRMVELMGGTLEVESTPGAGSTFSFAVRLPVLANRADSVAPPRTRITGYRGRRRRVLVVDDVGTNRDVLRELLAPLGFEVHEAATGVAALATAASAPPDVVLLDLRMPGMDGFELARRLRALPGGAQLKIIAMSASVLSFNRDDAFAAGCDDFLPKPFREDDLLARIGLALPLEWIAESADTPRGSRAPCDAAATRLPPTVIAELLASARRGEIAQLRKLLADHAADPLAAELENLARNYRMEQIRELLQHHALSGFHPDDDPAASSKL